MLDGEIGTNDDIIHRSESEEFLLDLMGFSFVRGRVDCEDGQEYYELVDELFDGLVEINLK